MEHKSLNPIRVLLQQYYNGERKGGYFATAVALASLLSEYTGMVRNAADGQEDIHVDNSDVLFVIANLLLEAGDPAADPASVLCQLWNVEASKKAYSLALERANRHRAELGQPNLDTEPWSEPIPEAEIIAALGELEEETVSHTSYGSVHASFLATATHIQDATNMGELISENPSLLYKDVDDAITNVRPKAPRKRKAGKKHD